MTMTIERPAKTFLTIHDMLDALVLDWLHAGGFNEPEEIVEILSQNSPDELTKEMCSALELFIRADGTILQRKCGEILESGEYLVEEFEAAFARAAATSQSAIPRETSCTVAKP